MLSLHTKLNMKKKNKFAKRILDDHPSLLNNNNFGCIHVEWKDPYYYITHIIFSRVSSSK